MGGETEQRIPPHLRRFVVQQDYAAYTEVDHAVWRFVLLQMRDRMQHAAHPAYARGLTASGMSVERIPRIAEIDAGLHAFGWGAVCVSGFIPPRAFQEFQARSILPIAAEIRSVEHLPYTPAPDIIHEAAGHAPILPDAEYASFLRRIGAAGMRAFGSAHDAALYDVIYRLSELKEQRDAAPDDVTRTEAELASLTAASVPASEAARLSRLYWWSVEYGLVGTPRDYRLYGAGLLSSLGESFFCHEAAVQKLPLDASCAEVDYDITRPQPQLFVARDFGRLHEVLDAVCSGMAFRSGGLAALETARAAGEIATLELDSGMQATGIVGAIVAANAEPILVALRGGCALGVNDRLLDGEAAACTDELAVVFGPLAGGVALGNVNTLVFGAGGGRASDGRTRIDLASGLRIEGRLEHAEGSAGCGFQCVTFGAARVLRGEQVLWAAPAGRVALLGGERLVSVAAGARDAAFWPAAAYPTTKSPVRPAEREPERARRVLYERGLEARQHARAETLCSLHDTLEREHPGEWLLRWNLLESFERMGIESSRRAALVRELFALERRLHGKYPIAMGLRYLGYVREPH